VAGLEPPDRGEIFFAPVPVTAASVIEIVLRPGRYRAVAGSAGALRTLEYSPVFAARDIAERVIADLALAPLMRVPIRALSRTAQRTCWPSVVGTAADTFDRRAIRGLRTCARP